MDSTKTNNRVYLNDAVIEVVMGEWQDAEGVLKLRQQIDKISRGRALDILVDVSHITGGDGTGRPVAQGHFFKDLSFQRLAVFGARTASASLAIKEILEALAQPDRLKFFHGEEDARAWLQYKS